MPKLNRTQVDNFVLRSVIHESGAGTCYQARNQESNTETVVTILRNVSKQGAAAIRENAAALDAVSHDAVYKPANIGDLPDDELYVATGHFGTHLLSRKTKDDAFKDPVVVLELIHRVASGAAAAASAGVVHENLSPDHIWLRLKGIEEGAYVPLVVDWAVPFLGDNQLKPAYVYAAPESRVGEPVDVAGAVYALGILTYEMLAGGHPSEYGWQVVDSASLRPMPPNLDELRPDLKPETYELVQTSIRTQSWARYGTFPEFLAALDLALEAERSRGRGGLLAATAAAGVGSRRNLIAGVAALALLAAVILWVVFGWLPNRSASATDDVTPTAMVAAAVGDVTGVTLSADTVAPDAPLAVTWEGAASVPNAEYVVLLVRSDGEEYVLGTQPSTGEGAYRVQAALSALPADAVAPGAYALVVRLQSALDGSPIATSGEVPLRISALAEPATATPDVAATDAAGSAATPDATATESAAAAAATETADAEASETPAEEATPAPSPTATPTPEPTPTEEPTQPPVPAVRVATIAANIRSGPGLAYDIVGGLRQGAEVEVIATDDFGFWYLIRLVDGRTGWIAASVTEPAFSGALEGIPVAEFVPPVPTAPFTPPSATASPTPTTGGTQNTPTPTPDLPTPTPIQPTPTPIQPTPTPISPTG